MKHPFHNVQTILGSALFLFVSVVPAWPCAIGRLELAAPLQDLFFRPGTASNWTGTFVYKNTGLGNVKYCGMYARSRTPGVSVVETYGSPGLVRPPFVWADVGASAAPGTLVHGNLEFRYDGTGTDGYIGRIEFAARDDSDVGPPAYRYAGAMNVYLDSIPQATWFRVTANSNNVAGHRVRIDHPYLNGHPEAILFATHVWNAPGQPVIYDDHPISVSYDALSARWTVQHDDLAIMTAGTTYNLRIDPSATRITANSSNIVGSMMRIDQENATGSPYAAVLVTTVTNNAWNPHPIAVGFVGGTHWYVQNADGALIPTGATFHVKVFGYSNYASDSPALTGLSANTAGVGIDMDGISRTIANSRYLDWPWLNGRASAILIVTPNRNPLNRSPGVVNAHYTGVWYDGSRWAVFNENSGNMPTNAGFNVWSNPMPRKVWIPQGEILPPHP